MEQQDQKPILTKDSERLICDPDIFLSLQNLEEKDIIIKECWSDHRITLISYETQYVAAKNKNPGQNMSGVRKKRAQSSLHQSGFLFGQLSQYQQATIFSVVQKKQCLNYLFFHNKEPDMVQVKEFIVILLKLKAPCIRTEFIELYEQMVSIILKTELQDVVKEEKRIEWKQRWGNFLVQFIGSHPKLFPAFRKYLQDDRKQTEKLLIVEIYCLLAERYNFNVNQYYDEAFQITLEPPKKKAKMQEQSLEGEEAE